MNYQFGLSLCSACSCSLPPWAQFGNSCYVNSVVQALYFCRPFRKQVLAFQQTQADQPETLLSTLADLFDQIFSSRRKFGILHPRKFVSKVKKENGKQIN